MPYSKPIMTITELVQMGFSGYELRKIYHKVGFPVAFREGNGRTSPIKFNTELLDKHFKKINERRA